ncbi:MAG: hypothetical protein AAF226_13335 [Verrucomicrobiota bacterium]
MKSYKIFVNLDIFDEIPKTGKARGKIVEFIRSLSNDPHHSGDYSEVDETGRYLFTKIVGGYAVTYWPDTPVLEVKIVRICKADGLSHPPS